MSPSATRGLSFGAYRRLIYWTLAAGYVLVYFHRLCAAVVADDMMRDLGAGGVLIGLLTSLYFYPYAFMQLPAGLLADSAGPRRSIAAFYILACAGSVMLGLAGSVPVALAGRALVGIGMAVFFVPAMKVFSNWYRPREFASVTGVLIALGGVGSLIATSPLAFMSANIGWRASFISVGALTALVSLALWLVVRDDPTEKGYAGMSPTGAAAGKISLLAGLRAVLGCARFWPLALWFFFTSAIFFSVAGLWGGPYLMHVHGMDRASTGAVLSMFALGMIAGSPALTAVSDRVFKARKPVIVICAAMTAAITGALALFAGRAGVPLLYALFFGMGFFTNAIVSVGFTAVKELFPVAIAGTATGIANIFPFLGGALFQPLLGHVLELNGKTGTAFTAAGYRQAFAVLFLCALAALFLSFLLTETIDIGAGQETREDERTHAH